jgi:hypothetical protein
VDPWKSAPREYVAQLLASQIQRLSPAQRERWGAISVPFRAVPISAEPGHFVYVVAEIEGRVIYFEDVEEGWNVAPLTSRGELESRGFEQDDLLCLLSRLFEGRAPDAQMPPNKSLERTRDG